MVDAFAFNEPGKLDKVLPLEQPNATQTAVVRDGRVVSGRSGAFVRALQERYG